MPKNSKKRKSEIKKRKLSITSTKKQSDNSQNKSSIKKYYNYPPKKVIVDDEDELIEDYNIQIIDQNLKKNKTQRCSKNEDFSYDSLSTNKTEEITKARSVIKNNKMILSGNKKSYPKSKSKTPKKEKKSIKKSNEKKEKVYNLHVKVENPYYKKNCDESEEDLDDSDYKVEEDVKKRKRKSRKKSTRKKLDKEDIEMKDNTWTKFEFDSKRSILGHDYLPCREKEQKKIFDYIQEGLQTDGNYNSLYIAGMPGTGKTACVKTVINIIESEYNKINKSIYIKNSKGKILPPFTKLFLCGTEFPIISNIYKAIYKFIFAFKKGTTIKKCTHLLDKFFSNRNNCNIAQLNDPSNSHIILVIDEIDFLINKNQNLLYNIFNWTTYEGSKLIVISISNTLDLPNRLAPKIKSRMGNNKIMFKPYNKDELITIIESKGIEFENFTKDAIKLSCMKVAAINGDLRRIIQILTRAKEIYNLDNKKSKDKLIDKNYILKACEELFNSKLTKIIQSLQISEKIIICSILSRIKDINDNKIKVSDLYDKKDIFINKYNESRNKNKLDILWEEFQKIIYNLARIKLIFFCEKRCSIFMENFISIKFYTDEFVNACNEDEELKPVLDYLTNLISI